ncbi:DUF427-domain-containing protein [Mycena galopus ATCC 62051]|nr:DUF427-domain-containing protein [Mycena galopus ATCC 62051]
MTKVTVNGTTIAESTSTVVVEGNHYFPPDSLKIEFSDSTTSTVCPWKGTASYYNATIDGKTINDIAWYYPSASQKAKNIEGYVAFYKNKVTIE